jgi:hypothetical protein
VTLSGIVTLVKLVQPLNIQPYKPPVRNIVIAALAGIFAVAMTITDGWLSWLL